MADHIYISSSPPTLSMAPEDVDTSKNIKLEAKSRYTICLTMIVKNEGKIIRRLLDSVFLIVDAVCITDTGSTDDTISHIEAWGKENSIPTTICTSEFRNFGYARNASLANTKKHYPKLDFQLLLDADFIVELNGFQKDELSMKYHKYSIKQYDAWKSWDNARIVANWVDWEYHLRTHEYITDSPQQTMYAGEIRSTKINTLRIRDIGDGGSKADKFERDQRLLLEDVDDPNVSESDKVRCYYYLGSSFKNGGKPAEAIPWFEKRVASGGWYEEVYMSWCNIGECYQRLHYIVKHALKIQEKRSAASIKSQVIVDQLAEYLTEDIKSQIAPENSSEEEDLFLNNHHLADKSTVELGEMCNNYFTQAIQSYMKGYAFCKIRAEALYSVVKLLRERGDKSKGDHSKGLFLAMEGRKIPIPVQCSLEVQTGIHKYGFDSEIMILAYYVPDHKHLGQEAKDRLEHLTHEMDPHHLVLYKQNKIWYQ